MRETLPGSASARSTAVTRWYCRYLRAVLAFRNGNMARVVALLRPSVKLYVAHAFAQRQ
jgi:hypothetical protein